MSADIIQLGACDFDEAMCFLNHVFGEHYPHDFAAMLPAFYRPTDESMRCNYAVRERGRIAAIVGVFPIGLRIGGVALRVAGVGGVSVHPECRGRGYMNQLMDHAVGEMRLAGYDLSYLGGQRQRYAYFGYEAAGVGYRLRFTKNNIRHVFGDKPPGVTFEVVGEEPQTLAMLKSLHDAQPLFCDRPVERFACYLRSRGGSPWLVRDGGGRVVGYVITSSDRQSVEELVARDADLAAQMVHACVMRGDAAVEVQLRAPAGPIMWRLSEFAEHVSAWPCGNWQLFDWVKVVDTLLKAQHAARPLAHGSVTLVVKGAGVSLKLAIDPGGARCEATNDKPDLALDTLNATRLLFGPLPPGAFTALPACASVLSAWCPLPLGIAPADRC